MNSFKRFNKKMFEIKEWMGEVHYGLYQSKTFNALTLLNDLTLSVYVKVFTCLFFILPEIYLFMLSDFFYLCFVLVT